MTPLLKNICSMKSSICSYCALLIMYILMSSCGGVVEKNTAGSSDEIKLLVEQLRIKVQLNPDSLGVRYQLMNVLAQGGKYQEALLQNDTLMVEDTANAALWYRRGDILLQTGDSLGGIQALDRAVMLAPAFAEPQLQLASVYAGRLDAKALTITANILALSQEARIISQARFIRGLYYSNINETDQALAQFDDCIKSDYTFLDAYVEKGLLLYDKQRFSEALAVFERAIQVSNTFAEGYYHAGKCEEALGNREDAIAYYKKAIGLDGGLNAATEALKHIGG